MFKSLIRGIREFFTPFEVLYLFIALATLDHTIWASAFLFEGAEPPIDDGLWRAKGLIIAIAVDFGMLGASKLLQKSSSWGHGLALTISFLFAALISFYFQMIYILFHTPVFVMSTGVNAYWQNVLQPFVDARVLVLPLALPLLATAYTVSRIYEHRRTETKEVMEITKIKNAEIEAIKQDYTRQLQAQRDELLRIAIPAKVPTENDGETPSSHLDLLIDAIKGAPEKIEPGYERIELEGYWVDLKLLMWFNPTNKKTYGPYTRRTMLMSGMNMARKSRSIPSIQGPNNQLPEVSVLDMEASELS